ncbi:MAG: N-acetylmuramoyl-L-alanine amidase [bacterium]|nr:N-acetylmuramoyl-L-alanine amidase [bacterium]
MKKIIIFLFILIFAANVFWGARPTVYLKNISYYIYKDYTRIVLDLSSSLKVTETILPGNEKNRLYFDMEKCEFAKDYPKQKRKEITVKTSHLQRIRLAKKNNHSIRVVFDFEKIDKYTKFYLTSPFRIVFDVFQKKKRKTPAKSQTTAPIKVTRKKKKTEKKNTAGKKKSGKKKTNAAGKNGKKEPVNKTNSSKSKPKDKKNADHSKKTGKVALNKPPQPVGNKYSILRQLGLGVRTIVIDPGHGGKDPGTSNSKLKLLEKTLVLDIAKQVKSIFNQYTDYEIILTRSTDRYISLEERTAIANSKKGDLFVSIHLNSAPRKSARGVECYYLSMTTDSWAMRVAAQENAMSKKSIGEMSTIVSQIVKHARISESKVFTKYMQEHLVKRLRKKYKNIRNLGVKKAPFYVLAGAEMPAVLVEVSFLSNYYEGKRLKSPSYRYAIAAGIYRGIKAYIKSLGKNIKK